jgi:hypothetical protein
VPDEPEVPDEPDEPEVPDEPDEPEVPEEPDEPEVPEEPDEPEVPLVKATLERFLITPPSSTRKLGLLASVAMVPILTSPDT